VLRLAWRERQPVSVKPQPVELMPAVVRTGLKTRLRQEKSAPSKSFA
jgi:hypothetical protein